MNSYNEKEYQMFIIKIGLKVGYYRRLANMTQEQLSEASGMSLNFICWRRHIFGKTSCI